MAIATLTFHSQLLHRPTQISVLLPEGTAPKGVLYLLHGYYDGHDSFLRYSALERFCAAVPLAVVMPDAQNSFYMDTAFGQPYWQYICQEVPQVLKQWLRLEFSRQQRFLAGVSMGGYGAAKLALQEPDRFSKVYLYAPLTDMDLVSREGFDRSIDPNAPSYEQLHMDAILGGKPVAGTPDDLYHLLAQRNAEKLPEFAVYTGTEDFMYRQILDFVDALVAKGADCTLQTTAGIHSWSTWDPFIADTVAKIAAQLP